METIFGQKCLLIDPQTHRFLVMQRSNYKNDGGLWDMIGGRVDTGEDAREALRREALEEVGVELQTLHPLEIISHPTPNGDFFIFALWVCTDRSLTTDEITLSHEHTTYKRVALEEFLDLPLGHTIEKVKPQIVAYMKEKES